MSSSNATASPASSSSPSPASIWGPELTATFLASVIYGISVLQTFFYYTHHGYDRIAWKILVGVIFVLDTAGLALTMYSLQYYLVISWGIPQNLNNDIAPFPVEYILTAFLAFLVQGFYINTIRALQAPLAATLLLTALAITALVTGLILPGVQLDLRFISAIVPNRLNHLAFNIARGSALACDVGIVAALCWLLEERKTGVKRSNNMIDTLMLFAVQRGVLQAILELGEVLAYAIKPDQIYFLPFHVIVSRVYCTSLLATLNSRGYVARRGGDPSAIVRHYARRKADLEQPDHQHGHAIHRHGENLFVTHPVSGASVPRGGGITSTTNTGSRAIFTSVFSYLDPPFLDSARRSTSDGGNDEGMDQQRRPSMSIMETSHARRHGYDGRCTEPGDVDALDLEAAFRNLGKHEQGQGQGKGQGLEGDLKDRPPSHPWLYCETSSYSGNGRNNELPGLPKLEQSSRSGMGSGSGMELKEMEVDAEKVRGEGAGEDA